MLQESTHPSIYATPDLWLLSIKKPSTTPEGSNLPTTERINDANEFRHVNKPRPLARLTYTHKCAYATSALPEVDLEPNRAPRSHTLHSTLISHCGNHRLDTATALQPLRYGGCLRHILAPASYAVVVRSCAVTMCHSLFCATSLCTEATQTAHWTAQSEH